MSFVHLGRSGLIVLKFFQSHRSYHKTIGYRYRPSQRPGDHRQSRVAGRLVAETARVPLKSSSSAGRGSDDNNSFARGTSTRDGHEGGYSVAGPSSPQAYLYRLRHGRFDDLIVLLSAPYAVSPLRILTDVLREVLQLRLRLTLGVCGGIEDSADRVDAWESLQRMANALSDPLAVRSVLSGAIHAVKEATEAASEVGDRISERELQRELGDIESFCSQLRQWNAEMKKNLTFIAQTADDARYSHLLDWDLSNVVMAEIWHGLLELCSLTGAFYVAVESLNHLIELSERVECIDAKKKGDKALWHGRNDKDKDEHEEAEEEHQQSAFTLDNVVEVVEDEVRKIFPPVLAIDHIRAMRSCELARNFDVAHTLFSRYIQHARSGVFPLTSKDIEAALIALARCCNNTAHFAMLQELFLESEANQVVGVSVELYTALIDAVSRANENPQCMAIALALYRRLRDGGLAPTADTYAGLMACCAAKKDPKQAFAFYHEARHQCGVNCLSPMVYTNLLLAYAQAGYGADARATLEVLVEAGAPLSRGAFHAVLSGDLTVREAEEVILLMQTKYNISATPQTYAYLHKAVIKRPNGSSTVLQMFDWHELALKSLLKVNDTVNHQMPNILVDGHSGQAAISTSSIVTPLEKDLLARYPTYAEAVEGVLVRLRVDPTIDSRLKSYLRPLLRVAQLRMNSFTGMAPQVPTRVPKGAAIAVLAADVLANLEEWFMPFASYYSAVVIPYSSLVALRNGGGRRVDGTFEKGTQQLLNDPLWREIGSEQQHMLESRRRVLVKFLETYRDVIHLVSLEEELALSRDCDRYGIAARKTFARCAAFALNLARLDVANGTKVYAEQTCNIVLVSSSFDECGRYLVDLKREVLRGKKDSDGLQGLAQGLQRLCYHNPRTSPQWRPPQVSVASLIHPAVNQQSYEQNP
ncbi:hypothetical protein C3747_2g617 [Trypanosoma cruzi]|uniref:Pentacotripeptide-repeat region of PRORP domain-containing protein n=2 Tax=Trypanosoma cruzi TaxID=5693 RepID=Q4D1M3_TRYCC|nr:hypothetical protein, conserved [Trypanosoma cruzi]EAN86424.1 hypothetical protein, conserved [Trypanosoma cruzi]PWV21429.1 hypothetical protein C3747_2g617 [Trypanosoma cruzi]RNC59937.1 hypothetical protein TcCL_ESM02387 [Trypanosoma cruzi]|eukprot:XP_808275.1 hypothetical protein [Trypanosoma cruzi strain CL Brener]